MSVTWFYIKVFWNLSVFDDYGSVKGRKWKFKKMNVRKDWSDIVKKVPIVITCDVVWPVLAVFSCNENIQGIAPFWELIINFFISEKRIEARFYSLIIIIFI